MLTATLSMDYINYVKMKQLHKRDMNILKSLSFDENKLQKQQHCDNILSQIHCKDIVVKYLCASRRHAREQKKEFREASYFNIMQMIEKINKENDKILDELSTITNATNNFEICRRLQTSKLLTNE